MNIFIHQCSYQHCSQEPKGRNNQNVHLQMDKQNAIYIYIYIYIMEYYSVLSISEILVHSASWMNLEKRLSEASQPH